MSSAASSASGSVVAVDIGASSGRVIVGRVGPRELRLDEVHRFPNEPVAAARRPPLGRPPAVPRDPRRAARGRPARVGAALERRRRLVGRRLRAARRRRRARRQPVALPRRPPRGRRRPRPRAGPPGEPLQADRHPVPAVQHALPAGRARRHGGVRAGPDDAAHAGPARLLADRRGRRRGDERLDDRAARPVVAGVGVGPDRDAGPRPRALPGAAAAGRAARTDPRPGRRGDRPRGGDGGDPRRLARHGVGGRRGPGRRAALRLHRVRDVVARRRRAGGRRC